MNLDKNNNENTNLDPSENIELTENVIENDSSLNNIEIPTINIREPKKKSKKPLFITLSVILGVVITISTSTILTIFLMNVVSTSPDPEYSLVNPDGPTINIVNNGSSSTEIPMQQGDNPVALTVPQIAAKVNPSVVGIQAESFNLGTGFGTGIILSEDGYVVTNNHVIENADILTVVLDSGKRYNAELIGTDAKTDLAVLKFTPTEEIIPAEFGNSDALVVGDLAIAIGNPGGLELQGTLTGGYVSAINRDILVEDRTMTLIQTDASINPGNSGGPLINEYGQVIGINTIKIGSENFEGLGFAIPINSAKPIVDELITYGYVKGRPSIGISGQNISEEQSYFNDVPQGLLVGSVDPRSDAYAKGLKPGDIITGVNGTRTVSITEINKIKDEFKAGEKITLNIFRAGKEIDIKITLMDEQHLLAIPEKNDSATNPDSYDEHYDEFPFPFPFGN